METLTKKKREKLTETRTKPKETGRKPCTPAETQANL